MIGSHHDCINWVNNLTLENPQQAAKVVQTARLFSIYENAEGSDARSAMQIILQMAIYTGGHSAGA